MRGTCVERQRPGHRPSARNARPGPRPVNISAPFIRRPIGTTLLAVGVGVAATVVFGVYPGPLLDLAQSAGEFIR